MSARTPQTTRAADIVRGVLSLAGVAVLVIGVPAALLAWVGSPLPAGVPSPSDVADALRDTYIPDEFLVKALALVCWIVWIELTASLLVEAVAHVRGRKAGAVPLAGGLQRGAARLIAGVALLGAVTATKGLPTSGPSHPLTPSPQPVVALVVDDGKAGGDGGAAVAGAPAEAPPVALPVYEVQRRDTLWDIAETHLGDPFRWPEIFRMNEGCPQADGGCLSDPDLIHPGWQLQLPVDAVGLAPAAPAPAPAAEAPATTPAPAPAPATPHESVAIEGGMVLIDDGGPSGGDDVQLASEAARTTTGGMVLLPSDGAVPAQPDEAILAGPQADDEIAGAGPASGRD
jgi:nucleoid-associated protein YgaU